MAENSQQQQATERSIGKPPATSPLGEQSSDVSPPVAPKLAPLAQKGQRVIVTKLVKFFQVPRNRVVVAAVLICLAMSGILWQIEFPWYIAVLPIMVLILLSLVALGYIPRWSKFTGFGEYKNDKAVQQAKTLWDWLNLLGVFLIPFMIGVFTITSNIQQNNNTLDQQRETALQAYLGQMSDLLLVDSLRTSQSGAEVRQVARARTLTVLRSLDPARKGYLLQFLYEANLINKNDVIVDLSGADLSHADLRFADLSYADLSHADLRFADLSYADLTGANLYKANLSFAYLTKTILKDADLRFASFDKAEVTNKQLAETQLLTGTFFPDGKIHP